jgi:hypothetical protein
MYTILLALHSGFRWFVLTSILFTLFNAYKGWWFHKKYTAFDNYTRHATATLAHIQLALGISLYFISPVIDYFIKNFREAIHQRELRFFGLEHSSMMLLAILILTIGSIKAKRKSTDKEKFKTIALWFSLSLFILLTSIPWAFSPLVSRPNFRLF